MNILIVTQYFWPERFKINDIAQSLVGAGHQVTILTGLPNYPDGNFFAGYSFWSGPFREERNGVKIIRVPLIPRGRGRGLKLALNYLSFCLISCCMVPFIVGHKVDKIFVYQLSPVTSALPAIILKWIKRAPVYFWVTDLWPETLAATGVVKSRWALDLWGKFVTFLYRQSKFVLVSSKGFVSKIRSRGIESDKIIYWPQWGEELFTKNFNQLDKNKLNEIQLPPGFIILFAGNIGTSQGFETILKAAELTKSEAQIKWVILGEGLAFNWVKSEVEKRHLTENFILLGSKPLEDMPYYYSQSDVLLASLKKDPLFAITVPAKIQSYLPSGKPILISMDGEGADLVKSSQAGIACPANDPEALAQGAIALYRMSSEERNDLGLNARKFYFENFEKEKLLTQLLELLSR